MSYGFCFKDTALVLKYGVLPYAKGVIYFFFFLTAKTQSLLVAKTMLYHSYWDVYS